MFWKSSQPLVWDQYRKHFVPSLFCPSNGGLLFWLIILCYIHFTSQLIISHNRIISDCQIFHNLWWEMCVCVCVYACGTYILSGDEDVGETVLLVVRTLMVLYTPRAREVTLRTGSASATQNNHHTVKIHLRNFTQV